MAITYARLNQRTWSGDLLDIAYVSLTPEFKVLPRFARLDFLQDWIGQLEELYDQAHAEAYPAPAPAVDNLSCGGSGSCCQGPCRARW